MKSWLALLFIVASCALGFGLGYRAASPSLFSPESWLDLASQVPDRQAKQAAKRYEEVQKGLRREQEQARKAQEQAKREREQAERVVSEARKKRQEMARQLTVHREQAKRRIDEFQERARIAQEAASQRALEDADRDAGVDLSEELDAAQKAHTDRVWALRGEMEDLRLVVSSQEGAISALRQENTALDQLVFGLGQENVSLTRRLEISTLRYEESESRIEQLSGRRIRLRPAVLVGAVRGLGGGWSPGVSIGVAITW